MVSRLPRFIHAEYFDIEIVESRCTIIVRQKWRFEWFNIASVRWINSEKQNYKAKLLSIIEGMYTGVYLEVTGNSGLALRNKGKRWDIEFNIEEVPHSEH